MALTWSVYSSQQWMYPCGGMPTSTNRSLWPVSGGAVAIQPGWFQGRETMIFQRAQRADIPPGHKTAMIYVNIGINAPGEVAPPNMSHPVVPPFQITGPTNTEYPNSSFCLPQVPLVPNLTFNIGDNITIQVIELAQHGAAIYNVSILIDRLPIKADRIVTVCRCNASRPSRCTRGKRVQLLQFLGPKFPVDLCNRQPQQRCFTNGNRILDDISHPANAHYTICICAVVRGESKKQRKTDTVFCHGRSSGRYPHCILPV